MTREEIFTLIHEERNRQDQMWGLEFDDEDTANDWCVFICEYAIKMARNEEKIIGSGIPELIKIAALAVAAIETHKRNGQFAPRHYDGGNSENLQTTPKK